MKRTMLLNGVYRIRNLNTSDVYIGSAAGKKGFAHRFDRHRSDLNCVRHPNAHLQNAWIKYGSDYFVFEILLYCNPEDCLMYEQIAIDYYKPHYNLNQSAYSRLGSKVSKETRARISASMTGNKNPSYGRYGDAAPYTKLTKKKVEQIRRMLKTSMTHRKIANYFGVSETAVSNIKTGRTWSNV